MDTFQLIENTFRASWLPSRNVPWAQETCIGDINIQICMFWLTIKYSFLAKHVKLIWLVFLGLLDKSTIKLSHVCSIHNKISSKF